MSFLGYYRRFGDNYQCASPGIFGHEEPGTTDHFEPGYVPASDGDPAKFLSADGTFKTVSIGGPFVLRQMTSPGITEDAPGNFHVARKGMAGQFFASSIQNSEAVIQGINDGNGVAVEGGSSQGAAIYGHSSGGFSGYFQSELEANTVPTLVIQQIGAVLTSNTNLLEVRLSDDTKILQFYPNGSRLGLGQLPIVPDTMLHLFGGFSTPDSASIIIQNDSRTDLSDVSKVSFSDTNAQPYLSNAIIQYHTLGGATTPGNLQFFVNGIDNDTPADLAMEISGATRGVNFQGNIDFIKGQPLDWPAANGFGVLSNDGSGNLSWQVVNNVSPLGSFVNNAAAVTGGLTAGDLYTVTGGDPLILAVVF